MMFWASAPLALSPGGGCGGVLPPSRALADVEEDRGVEVLDGGRDGQIAANVTKQDTKRSCDHSTILYKNQRCSEIRLGRKVSVI